MRKYGVNLVVVLIMVIFVLVVLGGCQEATTRSGIKMAETAVKLQKSGKTVEQENITKRLELENQPGSIKHLYAISPFSGQCIFYSTVRGKVTSSGKRLSPGTVAHMDGNSGFKVYFGSNYGYTQEVMEDDGTYGKSVPYIYWWDVVGNYRQLFPNGLVIIISDVPIPIKSVTMNLEVTSKSQELLK